MDPTVAVVSPADVPGGLTFEALTPIQEEEAWKSLVTPPEVVVPVTLVPAVEVSCFKGPCLPEVTL
jgi:hypothetical protein